MMDPKPFVVIADSWTTPESPRFLGYSAEPVRGQTPTIARHQDTTEERLAFCMRELVPIWERWTDGNQALRQFLESPDFNHPTRPSPSFRMLLQALEQLHPHQREAGGCSVTAVMVVAQACIAAHIDAPVALWRQKVDHALHLDTLAQGELRRLQKD